MPSRFPISAVPLVDDPFCSDGFCLDNPCIVQLNPGGDYVGQTYQVVGATSVQWMTDGTDVPGAVGQFYTTTAADIGKYLTARSAEGALYEYCATPCFIGCDTEEAEQYEVYMRIGTTYCKDPGGIPEGLSCPGFFGGPAGGPPDAARTGTCSQASAMYLQGVANANTQIRIVSAPYDMAGCKLACGCMPNPASTCGPFEQYGVYWPYGILDTCDTSRYFTKLEFFSTNDNAWLQFGLYYVISEYIGQNAAPYLDTIVKVKYVP